MNKLLKNGILLVVVKSDKSIVEILISPQSLYLTPKIIDNKEVIIPTVILTETFTPVPFNQFDKENK